MNQEYGLNNKITIETLYVQLVSDSDEGVMYSYPPKDVENTELLRRRQAGNYDISEVYTKCKETGKAILNYGMFDQ